MQIEISLNGTKENPFHKLGLSCNPFPQTGTTGYDAACMILQSLGADPIPNKEYIREKLKGFGQELIDLCCEQYKEGEYVKFTVTFED